MSLVPHPGVDEDVNGVEGTLAAWFFLFSFFCFYETLRFGGNEAVKSHRELQGRALLVSVASGCYSVGHQGDAGLR